VISMTQYVTIKFDGKNVTNSLYTYRHDKGGVSTGDKVIVDAAVSGPRPARVVATSSQPPSKEPAPDGYKGRVNSGLLR